VVSSRWQYLRLPLPIGLALALFSAAAVAHHPMGGMTLDRPLDALLSGLGHPLLDVENAIFLIGFAVLMAALQFRSMQLAFATFILAGLVGVLAGSALGNLIGGNGLAAALLSMLALLLMARGLPRTPACLLALVAGAMHGLIYAEALPGAGGMVLLGYAAGLAISQTLLLAIAGRVVARLSPGRASLVRSTSAAACLMTALALVLS